MCFRSRRVVAVATVAGGCGAARVGGMCTTLARAQDSGVIIRGIAVSKMNLFVQRIIVVIGFLYMTLFDEPLNERAVRFLGSFLDEAGHHHLESICQRWCLVFQISIGLREPWDMQIDLTLTFISTSSLSHKPDLGIPSPNSCFLMGSPGNDPPRVHRPRMSNPIGATTLV